MRGLRFKEVNKQRGFVSLLTVMMFMILTSIVTVSFVTLTLGEQRQTLNDDLSKGAYEAAQAGIEDAKRAIRYCKANGCEPALYNQSCPGFYSSPTISSGLGLTPVNSTVQVGHASANQRYTCVTVSNELVKFWGELDPASASAQTIFIPLRAATPFNSVKISWSMKSGTATVPTSGQVQTTNPMQPNWNPSWPAMMRAMLVSHPLGNISESNVTSKSSFFVPTSSGGGNTAAYSSMGKRVLTTCNPGATGGANNIDSDYVCQMTITGLGGANDWYLQLAPYYQTAAFKIELMNGVNGAAIPMRDAGYLVDSTGGVADVYRRVQVVLGPDDVVSPSAAIQSGERLCKNFSVTGFFNAILPIGENCDPSVSAVPNSPAPPDSGDPDVGVGGYCSVNVCEPPADDGGGGVPTNYTQLIVNTSNNPPGLVAGCTWVISDGTRIENQHCDRGDQFSHTFPTTPYPPKARYEVTLTIRLTSGAQANYTATFYLPG